MAMSPLQRFSDRLKQLRGAVAVKDLAARAGVAPTALYKAEGGEQTVSWKTVENAYGSLCKSDETYSDLLMLWALTQSQRPVGLYTAKLAMAAAVNETAAAMTDEQTHILREVEMMDLTDQRTFVNFAKHYRRSRYTRDMAKVWMDSADGWVREMEKAGRK